MKSSSSSWTLYGSALFLAIFLAALEVTLKVSAMDDLKRAHPSSISLIPFPRVGRSVDSQSARSSNGGGGYYGEKRTGKSVSLIPFPRVGRRSGPMTWDVDPEMLGEAALKQKRQRLVPFPRVGKRQALIPFPRTGKRAENNGIMSDLFYERNSNNDENKREENSGLVYGRNNVRNSEAEIEREKLASSLRALQKVSQRENRPHLESEHLADIYARKNADIELDPETLVYVIRSLIQKDDESQEHNYRKSF